MDRKFQPNQIGAPARITRYMRHYLYADLRWISMADDNYGVNTENASESAGTGVDPVIEWENQGEHFKAGDVIKNVQIRARANNTQVLDVEIYMVYTYPSGDQWLSGLNLDSEVTTVDLYRDMWKTPTLGQPVSLAAITHRTKRDYELNYTVPADGDFRLFVKPIGTLTATRYMPLGITIDYELGA